MAVSGSVTMELLASNKPTVVYYRVGSIGHLTQRLFRRSKFITLVNILAINHANPNNPNAFLYDKSKIIIPYEPSQDDQKQMLFPEFLTNKNRSKEAASILINWLTNPESLAKTKRELDDLLKKTDEVQNPLKRAAEILLMVISNNIPNKNF
jgi:lipid A disaccharide synthetase